jgi:hypothetical protein
MSQERPNRFEKFVRATPKGIGIYNEGDPFRRYTRGDHLLFEAANRRVSSIEPLSKEVRVVSGTLPEICTSITQATGVEAQPLIFPGGVPIVELELPPIKFSIRHMQDVGKSIAFFPNSDLVFNSHAMYATIFGKLPNALFDSWKNPPSSEDLQKSTRYKISFPNDSSPMWNPLVTNDDCNDFEEVTNREKDRIYGVYFKVGTHWYNKFDFFYPNINASPNSRAELNLPLGYNLKPRVMREIITLNRGVNPDVLEDRRYEESFTNAINMLTQSLYGNQKSAK